MKVIIFLAAFSAVMYVLYLNGYLAVKNIKSVYYIGKNGFMDKRCYAKFSACTGNVKKVIKFKENRTYTFTFNAKLEKGEAKAVLRSPKGENLLVLTAENPVGTIDADTSAYRLVFEMYKAYGSYELTWK